MFIDNKFVLSFTLSFLVIRLFAQTNTQVKEVKIAYKNGLEVFNICISGCNTYYDDKK